MVNRFTGSAVPNPKNLALLVKYFSNLYEKGPAAAGPFS
jgi:hypothetical protein